MHEKKILENAAATSSSIFYIRFYIFILTLSSGADCLYIVLELQNEINLTLAVHVELFDLMSLLGDKSTKISETLANSILEFIRDMELSLTHILHIVEDVEDEITSECNCPEDQLREPIAIFQRFVIRIKLLIAQLRFENLDPSVITTINLKQFLEDNSEAIEGKMAIFDNVAEILERIKGIVEVDFTTHCVTLLTTSSTQSLISETSIAITPSMTATPSTIISLSDITTPTSIYSSEPTSAVFTTVTPSSPETTSAISTTVTTGNTSPTVSGKNVIFYIHNSKEDLNTLISC